MADLILNVMDDKDIYRKFKEKTAREILVQLEVENKKIVNMFNKIDSLKEEEIVLLKKEQDNRNCIFVSSLKKKDMAHLKEKIWEVLKTRKRIYQ